MNRLWVLVAFAPWLAAQDLSGVNAVLWMQSSVEHDACTQQAYRAARAGLDRGLKDRKWTAALEQTGSLKKLPPAIILDLDETVLDNTPAQARFIVEGTGAYNAQMWDEWSRLRSARALPGAAEFLKYAASRGVTIFYVSNRGAAEKEDTRANLTTQGLPLTPLRKGAAELGESLMLRGERPEWVSDKTSRRILIAKYYRIVQLFGDDLNDFLSGAIAPHEQRQRLADAHASWWGSRWIVLPNPAYGSWVGAATAGRTAKESLRIP